MRILKFSSSLLTALFLLVTTPVWLSHAEVDDFIKSYLGVDPSGLRSGLYHKIKSGFARRQRTLIDKGLVKRVDKGVYERLEYVPEDTPEDTTQKRRMCYR